MAVADSLSESLSLSRPRAAPSGDATTEPSTATRALPSAPSAEHPRAAQRASAHVDSWKGPDLCARAAVKRRCHMRVRAAQIVMSLPASLARVGARAARCTVGGVRSDTAARAGGLAARSRAGTRLTLRRRCSYAHLLREASSCAPEHVLLFGSPSRALALDRSQACQPRPGSVMRVQSGLQ